MSAKGDGPRILVIDDDKPFLDMMAEYLAGQGYDVAVAADGLEGFRRASRERFDLITVDIKMPELGGVEALRSMQMVKHPARMVVISGYLSDEICDDCREAGAAAVLGKPLELRHLAEVISRLLGGRPRSGGGQGDEPSS